MISVEEFTILLIRAFIKNESFDLSLSNRISIEDIFTYSKKHKIENLCLTAIKHFSIPIEKDILLKWEDVSEENIASLIVQESEKERLTDIFNVAEIKFLPLKGWYLRSLYPRPDFRFMSDLDILIEKNDRKKISDILKNNNYTGGIGDYGSDDSYYYNPCIHLEVHIDMVSVEHDVWYKYYQNIWDKAIQVSGYEYKLNLNDYFIYMMINYLKDYTLNGTGIRGILDFYIFLTKHKSDLDLDYIKHEFEELNVYELVQQTMQLVNKWFGENPEIKGSEMGDKLLKSEIYGTSKELVQHRYDILTGKFNNVIVKKTVFLLRRAFPEMKIMRYKYPILNKFPILLPVCWLIRLFRYSDRARIEISNIQNINNKL